MTIDFCERATAFGDLAWIVRDGADQRVPDGIHWHVAIGRDGGLPAGPTVVVDLRTNADSFRLVDPRWAWPPLPPGGWEIDDERGLDLTLGYDLPHAGDELLGWPFVQADGELTLHAVDRQPTRTGLWSSNAARSRPLPGEDVHWEVASGHCEVVRVTGRGHVVETAAWVCTARFELDHDLVLARASLAREQAVDIPHYLPARDGSDEWEQRVEASAPPFRLPADSERPGELEPDPSREIQRTRRLVDPRSFGEPVDSVRAWCLSAYLSLDTGVRGQVAGTSDSTTVAQWADESYLQASVDPGVARWQGLSGTLDREPEPSGPRGLAAALVPMFRLRGRAEVRRDRDHSEAEMFYEEEIGGYLDLRERVRDFPGLEDGSWWDLELIVVPIPYLREAPQDGPVQPSLVALERTWNAVTIDRWSATIGLDGVVPRGETALVQTAPTAQTLHGGVAGAPDPMLPGYSAPFGVHVVNVTDRPGIDPAIDVAVRLQDWIGRWGPAGGTTVTRPARPPVPPPRGRTILVPGPAAGGTAPASSGMVRVDVTAPWPAGPGAVDLAEVHIRVPREPAVRVMPVTAVDVVAGTVPLVVEFPAAATVPGQVVEEVVTLESIDVEGASSSEAAFAVRVVDPRPIRAPLVGPRLIASSRRGNSPTVTVTLDITAAPHARAYRVLIAGETALRRAFGLPSADATEPRAERAAAVQREMPAHDERANYSWASTGAFPVSGGHALATIELPAGTDGVVFARAVAVTTIPGSPPTETVSTPFQHTRPVAIIVPRSDFPPVPDLRIVPHDDGTATVTVRVMRPPSSALSSLQSAAEPPARIEARLVEPLGAGTDPAFWPELAVIPLVPIAGDPVAHEGTVDVRGRTWLRTAVAACVRYPAEPTLAAGATPTASEVASTGVQHDRIPSPWGPFSAPAWIDTTGDLPSLVFIVTAGSVQVTADGLPSLPAVAPPWTMQLFSGATSLAPAPGPAGAPIPASTGMTISVAPGLRYGILLRDPFGVAHGVTPVPTEP